MTKRRQYGTGSVYQRASDGRWLATIEHGYTRTGGRRRITVSAKTEAACKAALKAKARDLARGEDASGRTTVKAWSETWLEIVSHTDKPKSHSADKIGVGYIVSAIGHKRLSDLTPADVRAVREAVTANGNGSSTARRYNGTLMRMLKAAMQEGHDVPGRVLAMKPPKEAANDREAIPIPDVLRLLAAAGDLPHGSRWMAAFLLGLRQAEALGLTWSEVGPDLLAVSWQLQWLTYRDKHDRSKGFLMPDGFEARQLDRTAHLVRPKSGAGWRVLPLLPALGASLDVWRAVEQPSPHGLIWPTVTGRPKRADDDRKEFHALQAEAKVAHPSGRPYHVHEIRHTTATLLLELGVPEAVRVQIMGHSTVASTNAYQHIDVAMAREALTKFGAALKLG